MARANKLVCSKRSPPHVISQGLFRLVKLLTVLLPVAVPHPALRATFSPGEGRELPLQCGEGVCAVSLSKANMKKYFLALQ